MYDIRQLKPALYLLVIMGISGFALATGASGLWLVAMLLIGLNILLVRGGRFRPIPRWIANGITVLAVAYVALNIRGRETVTVIGHFLVLLQIVKLYEQRANRDLGQLLVLSLLLMVAAAISTASLEFGLLLVVYLVLSLYSCLLFHLKVETDVAKRAMGLSDDQASDLPQLRQNQQRLTSSMGRLTLVVSAAAISCGVLVFLFFPRGAGASFLGGPEFKSSEAVTGFSGTVSFQEIARITQNPTPVAYLDYLRDGLPVQGGEMLYFRGNTMGVYVSDPDASDRWTWKSTPQVQTRVEMSSGGNVALQRAITRPGVALEQHWQLEPVGMEVLPALAGAYLLRIEEPRWMLYGESDGTIALQGQPIRRRYDYVVFSDGKIPSPLSLESEEALPWLKMLLDRMELQRLDTRGDIDLAAMTRRQRADEMIRRFGLSQPPGGYGTTSPGDIAAALAQAYAMTVANTPYAASDELINFILDPEVSGTDAQGRSLAQLRLETSGITDDDERIARNVERYLRTQYAYTLDVTDNRLSGDQDPLAWFVSKDGRRGHCEYFAGSMAAALQAIGIPARVVVGFRTEEYNPQMERWVVRQSDAHAWVEVLTRRGWISFDPTSGNVAAEAAASAGIMQQMRQWLEFLQYTWANNVVAYDNHRQENLLENFEARIYTEPDLSLTPWQRFQSWLERQNLYIYSAQLMAWIIVAALVLAALFILWFVIEQWRMRRRVKRIGLRNLPPAEARRLVRQLAFYDDLMRLLSRHNIHRRSSQTPREFARSLAFLPRDAFDAVHGLTEIFYRVRYGGGNLTRRRRKWLGHSIERLGTQLGDAS